MQSQLRATDNDVSCYFDLFVNRRAYTIQAFTPRHEKGRCHYYRPRGRVSLSEATLRSHLEGRLTIGLYAINPATQRCKWVAIDADYSDALEDLLKLQWELKQDSVEAALERSRRGGHLWIFADQPLLARDCRVYIHNLARRLKLPVKGGRPETRCSTPGTTVAEGIEVFPKQDEIPFNGFGNAIRGPLGVHRTTGKRYWFYGADYTLQAQLSYLARLKRISQTEMARFVAGLKMPDEGVVSSAPAAIPYIASGHAERREFSILEHLIGSKRKTGRNYFTRCPSCARQGRDQSGDNLAISISDPRKYRCWAGCRKEDIRAALCCPIRPRRGLAS